MAHDAWDQVELWLARAARAEAADRPGWNRDRERLQVRLLLHRGEAEAAAELQWEIYRDTQQLEDYRRLVELATEHGLPTDYRQRARDWLVARLDKAPETPFAFSPRAANSRLEVYLFEHCLTEALVLCADRPVDPGLLRKLAQVLGDLDDSLPLYLRLVRNEVRNTNNQSYREGIALLQELHGVLETAAQRQAFAQALEQLRTEFKAKRNFIKWLNEAFSQ